ncbi:general odorant-binding protein 28a-like [Musca vetustissima]|uniref:general odorant-binding protein 28a-like n=1 Tax=Musca vetustissima TaxID=27455 RepID=UPI002AB5F742|nr:general odorant-binding protein 28a-like [Musca vetustissima]
MKSIGILLIIVVVGCYGLIDVCPGGDIKKIFADCLQEYGGDKALLTDWIAFKKAQDDKSKCFRTCAMKNCGWFDSNGKFTPEVPQRAAYVLFGGDESNVPLIAETGKRCLSSLQYDEKNICNSGENWSRCLLGHCKNCSLAVLATLL